MIVKSSFHFVSSSLHFTVSSAARHVREATARMPPNLEAGPEVRGCDPRLGAGPCVRVTVAGSPGVGKSALAVRYLTRRYIGEYTDTKCEYSG